MPVLDTRIEDLVAYAETRGGEDKTILFRNLIDLFLTKQAPTKQPIRSQLLDVLGSLTNDVEIATRSTAIDLVASLNNPPTDLALVLARDNSEIAAPLITRVGFSEEQLIDLIDTTNKSHHQLISTRSDLSANVWIALARSAPDADQSWSTPNLPAPDLPAPDLPANDAAAGNFLFRDASTPLDGKVTPMPARNRAGRAGSMEGKPRPNAVPNGDTSAAPKAQNPQNHGVFIGEETSLQRPERLDKLAEMPDTPVPANNPPLDRDPDPLAWRFTSDRDGFIDGLCDEALSLNGCKGKRAPAYGIGTPLLDFLGLNAKLGHPVARAFQRRSAVHQAPLYIDRLPKGHRYWSLSAIPQFDPKKDRFAGYKGRLVPAVSSDADEEEAEAAAYARLETIESYQDDDPFRPAAPIFRENAQTSDQADLPSDPEQDTITPDTTAPKATRQAPSDQKDGGKNPLDDLMTGIVQPRVAAEIQKALGALGGQGPGLSDPVSAEPSRAIAGGAQIEKAQMEKAQAEKAQAQTMPNSPATGDDATLVEIVATLEGALTALQEAELGIRPTHRQLQLGIAKTCLDLLKKTVDIS